MRQALRSLERPGRRCPGSGVGVSVLLRQPTASRASRRGMGRRSSSVLLSRQQGERTFALAIRGSPQANSPSEAHRPSTPFSTRRSERLTLRHRPRSIPQSEWRGHFCPARSESRRRRCSKNLGVLGVSRQNDQSDEVSRPRFPCAQTASMIAGIGLLPIPGPVDEAVLVVIVPVFLIFYREPMRDAWQRALR